jgi:hypothetical protein
MMSLNTQPTISQYNRLVYDFKRYLRHFDINLYLYSQDVECYGLWFKIWLQRYRGIVDLNIHMQNIEKNYNRKNLYLKRSTGRQTVINR